MSTVIENLVVQITADGADFKKGLLSTADQAKEWAAKMKPSLGGVSDAFMHVAKTITVMAAAAGVAAVGGVTLLVKQSLAATDAMAKLSDRTAINIETLYGWKVAADDVGVELESVARMAQVLQRNIGEAAAGNKTAQATFEGLGLSLQELARMSPAEALGTVSDALNDIDSQAKKTQFGMESLGRGFMQNGNFIRLGSEGMVEAEKRARELGLTLSRLDAAKLEEVNDSFDELKSVVAGAGNAFAVALSPYIKGAVDELVKASIESGNFKDQIRAMVDTATGSLGFFLDTWRGLRIEIVFLQKVFADFAVLVNGTLEFITRRVHGMGVAARSFGEALFETAKTGQSGFEVAWAAIKQASAIAFSFMLDGLSQILFAIADVSHYANKELGKSFEDAALRVGESAKAMKTSYSEEFAKITQDAGTQAEIMQQKWYEATHPNTDNTLSLWFQKNGDDALAMSENAKAAMDLLLAEPLPSENLKQWVEEAKAAIDSAAADTTAKAPGEKDKADNADGYDVEILKERHKGYSELLAEQSEQLQSQRLEFQSNLNLELEVMEQQHLNSIQKQEADAQARSSALWKSGLQGKLQIAGSILGQLSALQGSHSRKQFEVWKAAAIGETIVNTYSAAMGAFNSLASIPYVGYALGVAAAAATVAAGLANVNKIRSTSFGGGGGGGAPSAPSLGAGTGANAPTGGDAGGVYGGGQTGPAKQITIQLQGDSMYSPAAMRGLIDALNSQLGDGAVIGSLRAT